MIRDTSIESYNKIKEGDLISKKRWEVYHQLYDRGPATANELFKTMPLLQRGFNQANITTRLGELRDMGVVKEVQERHCKVTGMTVIEWDVTSNLPIKWEKPKRRKCKACNGKGYIQEEQALLFQETKSKRKVKSNEPL